MSREPFRPRSAYRHWTPVLTRWFDNDVFGHVNNTIYYGWLDTAVCGWLMEVGLLEVEGEDLIGLVIETGCAYARSEEHTSELQSLMRISSPVFVLKKKHTIALAPIMRTSYTDLY